MILELTFVVNTYPVELTFPGDMGVEVVSGQTVFYVEIIFS
jgi:hypothetical protein